MTARTSGLPSVRASLSLLGEDAQTGVARAGPTAEPPAEEWGGDRLEVAQERYERDDRGAEGSRGERLRSQLPHGGGGDRRTAGQGNRRPDNGEQGDGDARSNECQESGRCHWPEETSVASQTIAMPAATPRPAATPSRYQSSTPSIGPV